MVLLTAYLDESGTHGGSHFTVMGGYIATAERWRLFDLAWKAHLSAHGIKFLHIAELLQPVGGQFNGWSRQRRIRFFRKCQALFDEHYWLDLSVVLRNEDYLAHYLAGDPKMRKGRAPIDSAFGVCFRLFLTAAVNLVKKYQPDGVLTFVCEAGHRNMGAAKSIFAEHMKHSPEQAPFLSGVRFQTKEESPGVQAADAVAHPALWEEEKGVARFEPGRLDTAERLPDVRSFRIHADVGMLNKLRASQIEFTKDLRRERRDRRATKRES